MNWIFCPLDKSIDKSSFNCGQPSLDDYLKKYASQNAKKGIAVTIVAIPESDRRSVAGYYSASMAQIEFQSLPDKARKGLPRYPVPAMKIGRLAVDHQWQGQGLGGELLVNAMERAVALSTEIGIYAIVVDALDERVKQFYLKFGFTSFQDRELSLFLPLKKVIQLFA